MIRKIENLAFEYEKGSSGLPCMVFLPGFRSDMTGTKARFLALECRNRGQSCLLLDYSGHGLSGGAFEDGSIGIWKDDVLKIIDSATDEDLVVVGSSMGGWIGLHTALSRPEKVQALIGIAAAPDFTRGIDAKMSAAQRAELAGQGFFRVPSDYGEDLVITRKLIEDGEAQCLLDKEWDLEIPVTLIQGRLDADVPWQTAERIKAKIARDDTRIIYVEDGDHRLSRPEDLDLIAACVSSMSRAVQDRDRAGGDD